MYQDLFTYNSFTEGDKIQNGAIRYFIGVHNKAALLVLVGDIGWSNSKTKHHVNMTKMWNRLMLMENDRLTKKGIRMGYQNWKGEVQGNFKYI